MTKPTVRRPLAWRELADQAEQCRIDALSWAPGQWERITLETMAGHCRTAATVFELDPTLVTEPEDTGRFRSLYLIAEIGRQVRSAVKRTRTDFRLYTDQHRRDDQDFAELSVMRAAELTTAAVVVLPRMTSSPDGLLSVSQVRFAANHYLLTEAVKLLRSAVIPSLRLDIEDPRVAKVVEIAEHLENEARVLAGEHEADLEKLHTALGLPS